MSEESAKPSRSKQILGGVKVDAVAMSKLAMASFERLWGSLRVLDPQHPKRIEYIEQYYQTLSPLIEQLDSIALVITPYTFLVDEQEVLTIDRATENYIYRLHQDGIRKLVWSSKITPEEIKKFVEILEKVFTQAGNLEDDIVTMMWGAEFAGIRYENIEGFVAKVEGESEGGETALDHAASSIQVDDVMKYATSSVPITDDAIDMSQLVSSSKAVGGDDRALREQAADLLEGISEDRQQSAAHVFRFSEDERKILRQKIEAGRAELGAKFAEIAYATVAALGDSAAPAVAGAFGEFALQCVASSAAKSLLDAIQYFNQISTDPAGAVVRKSILAGLGNPQLVEAVVKMGLEPGASPDMLTLLNLVGAQGFRHIWNMLYEAGESMLPPPLLSGILETNAAGHVPFLIALAVKGDARQARLALDYLRKLDVAQFSQALLPALAHPSPGVRAETVNVLRKNMTPQVARALSPLMNDGDEAVRRAAMTHLTRAYGAKMEDLMLAVLTHADFNLKSAEEKTWVIRTIGKTATEQALGLIRHIAEGAFPFKEERESRTEAIAVLGSRGTSADRALLEKLAGAMLTGREYKALARDALAALNDRVGAA